MQEGSGIARNPRGGNGYHHFHDGSLKAAFRGNPLIDRKPFFPIDRPCPAGAQSGGLPDWSTRDAPSEARFESATRVNRLYPTAAIVMRCNANHEPK